MKQRNASVCLLLILCKGLLCCAQITAADQQKINIIQGWVQEQLTQGKQPTQEQMDSINKASPPQPSPLPCRDKLREVVANTQATQQGGSADGKALPFGKGGDGLSVITKQCMVGGSLSVPENKRWKIKRVFVTNGIGKPEPLKHNLSGCWSRRINQEHRIIYEVTDNKMLIHSLKGHY